jgi:hypothetical protein
MGLGFSQMFFYVDWDTDFVLMAENFLVTEKCEENLGQGILGLK